LSTGNARLVAELLVIAHGTLGGPALVAAVRARLADGSAALAVRVVAPAEAGGPRLAQARADLVRGLLARAGVAAEAEAGPAGLEAAQATAREDGDVRDVVVARPAGMPASHADVLVAPTAEPPVGVVLADRTAHSAALRGRLAAEGPGRAWVLVVPATAPEGAARARLGNALDALRGEGLLVAGALGPPDPLDAALWALEGLGADLLVVSTEAPSRSRWLRADLLGRLRAATAVPVQHVLGR
jgi:hypothetical protein